MNRTLNTIIAAIITLLVLVLACSANWASSHEYLPAREGPDLSFVYIKCTEGATFVDPKFKANVEGARSQGYNVGGYHYFRMTSSAHDQFAHFKQQLDGVDCNLIPMVDVEKNDGKTREELQDSLHVMLDLLEAAYGVKPVLYGLNASYNRLCAPEFNGYTLYIGRYGDDSPGAGRYAIWQYSISGIIKGIPQPVDLCRFHPDTDLEDILLPQDPTTPTIEVRQ